MGKFDNDNTNVEHGKIIASRDAIAGVAANNLKYDTKNLSGALSTLSSKHDDFLSDVIKKIDGDFTDKVEDFPKKYKSLVDMINTVLREYKKAEQIKGTEMKKLATQVIVGKYGNGKARIKALKKWLKNHGYKYSDKQVQKIQDKVNKILGSKPPSKKKKKNSKTGASTTVGTSAIVGTASGTAIAKTSGSGKSTSGSSNKTKAKKKKKVKTLLKAVTLDKKTTKKDQKIAELKEENDMLKKKAEAEAATAAAAATALKKEITDLKQSQDAKIAALEESNAKSIEDLTKQYDEKIEQITQKNADTIESKNNEINSLKEKVNNQSSEQTYASNESYSESAESAPVEESSDVAASDTGENSNASVGPTEDVDTSVDTSESADVDTTTEDDTVVIDDSEPDTSSSSSSSKSGGGSIVPGVLGVTAAGAATVAGVRYIKNKDKDNYEVDDYDSDDTGDDDYSYSATTNKDEPVDKYKAGSANNLNLDDVDDIKIEDDYDDDFNQELE